MSWSAFPLKCKSAFTWWEYDIWISEWEDVSISILGEAYQSLLVCKERPFKSGLKNEMKGKNIIRNDMIGESMF